MRVRKKEYSEVNVFDAGCERIRYLFNSFDNVIVNFSGGKDSTCILNMTLKIARELDRKVIVIFYDEEGAIEDQGFNPNRVTSSQSVPDLFASEFSLFHQQGKNIIKLGKVSFYSSDGVIFNKVQLQLKFIVIIKVIDGELVDLGGDGDSQTVDTSADHPLDLVFEILDHQLTLLVNRGRKDRVNALH